MVEEVGISHAGQIADRVEKELAWQVKGEYSNE